MFVSKKVLACAMILFPLSVFAVDDEKGCKSMVDAYLAGESSVGSSTMTNDVARKTEQIEEWRKNEESECAIQRKLMGMAAQLPDNAVGQ